MATTDFWPVKNRLKEIIDYAENPDRTIEKKYVDSDLYAALQYVSNDKKTDKRMYVVFEKLVFEAISGLADFVKCHEIVYACKEKQCYAAERTQTARTSGGTRHKENCRN